MANRDPTLCTKIVEGISSVLQWDRVTAVEFGNEPDYGTARRDFYTPLTPDCKTASGPPHYNHTCSLLSEEKDYVAMWSTYVSAALASGAMPMGKVQAGAFSGPYSPVLHQIFSNSSAWLHSVSIHSYGGNKQHTIEAGQRLLLSDASTVSNADSLKEYIALTHSNGKLFYVGEANSITGGGQIGVSNTFVSALWVIDFLFSMAEAGADGVNINCGGARPLDAFNNSPSN